MLKTVIERLQDYGRRVKATFEPNFDRDMSNGLYYLRDGERPDIAEGDFLSAAAAASSKKDKAEALVLFAYALVRADEAKLMQLNERGINGIEYIEQARAAYKRAVHLHPSPEILFTAALTSLGLGEREYGTYLERAVDSDPDDNLLIRVGRLATTLRLDGIVKKVKDEFAVRNLSIHLYPI